MSADGTVIPGRPRGSNPYPFDSPFIDAMSRLGFTDCEALSELEAFWWFMNDGPITPDDFASAMMRVLPLETEKEASMRRMGIVQSHEVDPRKGPDLYPRGRVKKRK